MIFSSTDFDHHEFVHAFADSATGLRGFVGVHSTRLGPAFGGCRMWPYTSEADAVRDVLRLSRGMSYKNALADLPYGGGKAVIMADPRHDKSPALFRAFGRCIDRLGGAYITAEDVGVSVEDMREAAVETSFVSGIPQDHGYRGGDPSPRTARGVFLGLKAAARVAFASDDLTGRTVAVQGVGHVGYHLCRELHAAGAKLLVADLSRDNLQRAVAECAATVVGPDEILSAGADILAPCALGGVLSKATIPSIRAKVIAGAANNQLATDDDAERLMARGIVYAPDYVINSGGIISVAAERDADATVEDVTRRIEAIGPRTQTILERAATSGQTPASVADAMAREIISRG